MIKKHINQSITFLLFLLGLQINLPLCHAQTLLNNEMQVHFINVGQADSELLEFQCGAVLIDAGAEDTASEKRLLVYLHNFFQRRTDLNNTLDLVILSHDHIDHDWALKAVAQTFHIKNFIDNGHTSGSGEANQGWMENNASNLGINFEHFSFEQITANGNHNGLTDAVIEPIHCSAISPQIFVLSGEFQNAADLSKADFANENNHSLVIKVKFGNASFLFTGDLETGGENKLLSYYAGTGMLSAGVWKVSHHGSNNGTSLQWLQALNPQLAVISCGQWFEGDHSTSKFNTYNYGHPRVVTLNLLSQAIPGNRQPLDTAIIAFNGIKQNNVRMTVTKNIYCTAWDQNITIKATSTGIYTVVTHDD